MRVYVHRNLNRNCWSILQRGKLQGYRKNLTLKDVEFRVRPGGHKRALREGRRNVHAFAVGEVSRGIPRGKPTGVCYNVLRGQFLDMAGRPVFGADFVRFGNGNVLDAYGVSY